jgi:hypothetical protein
LGQKILPIKTPLSFFLSAKIKIENMRESLTSASGAANNSIRVKGVDAANETGIPKSTSFAGGPNLNEVS